MSLVYRVIVRTNRHELTIRCLFEDMSYRKMLYKMELIFKVSIPYEDYLFKLFFKKIVQFKTSQLKIKKSN